MKTNITFVIFTYNEEKRVSYVVRNFIKYGTVLILDGGSTDKTKEITEELGAVFYTRPKSSKAHVETQEMYDFIKGLLKTEWVYWGYADNIAPKSLIEHMVKVSNQNLYKMVLVPLFTYLWGDVNNFYLKSHGQFLFHKDFIDFSTNHIHGMGSFTGSPTQLLKWPLRDEYALRHFSTYNMSKFISGHLRYAEAEADEKFQSGKRYSSIRMLAAMVRYCWIYGKNSFKNGALGLIVILNYAFFRFMTYVRLYELEHGITLESIEASYSKKKEELLKDLV